MNTQTHVDACYRLSVVYQLVQLMKDQYLHFVWFCAILKLSHNVTVLITLEIIMG